jgi:hypothetical protein
MVITNRERVGRALELLKRGLRPYLEREIRAAYKERWEEVARERLPARSRELNAGKPLNRDTQVLLQVMCDRDIWRDCFQGTLDQSHRNLVFELRDV